MRTRDRVPASVTATPRRVREPRLLLLGLVGGIVGTVLVGLVLGGPVALAKRGDLPLERAYGEYAVSLVSRLGGGNATNPQAQNPRALVAGRDAYTGSCGVCHGASGDGRGAFGSATYPSATDLRTHDAVEKSDGQLFWIIKNGLAFSGMPGFADQYDDQAIWQMVAYIRALQDPNRTVTPANSEPGVEGQRGGPRGNQAGRVGPFTLGPIAVSTPTTEQLDRADPNGSSVVARGAAIYFAQGCHSCHGAVGDAPGDLGLRRGGSPEDVRAVRQGRNGMPAYSQSQVSDGELRDLQAYLATIGGTSGRSD